MQLESILSSLEGVKGHGHQYTAKCPAHDDQKASLCVSCGNDGRILLKCQAGCSTEEVAGALGLSMVDLFPDKKDTREIIATYQYKDADGKILGEKIRYADKHFSWRRPSPGGWEYKKPTAVGLYNLPAIRGNSVVYLVEGEKDVDTITKAGKAATCSPDGAGPGKWKAHFTDWFRGKQVYIIQDNDDIGKEYAQEEAASISKVAQIVKVLDLCAIWSELPNHGDISDLVNHMGENAAIEALNQLTETAPEWKPKIENGLLLSTASDLLKKELPPVQFIVAGLLPHGLTLLASPPKYGKSWFVLDLCLSVASGRSFLGYNTNKSGCLYLALEDSENRLQDRVRKVLQGETAPENFYYALQSNDLAHGLIGQLEQFIEHVPGVKLIVIDTLQKVRGMMNRCDNAYSQDYNDAGALKSFADTHNLCVLLVHHLRKMSDDSDPFNRISGTNGILGAADTAITLTRTKRSDGETTLSLTGRDVDSSELILQFNKDTFRWYAIGNAEEIERQRARDEYETSPIVTTIKKLLAQSPEHRWDGTAKDLMEAGKYIAQTYLATDLQKLGYAIQNLERPLFDYDGIVHSFAKHGTASKKHSFYYQDSGQFVEIPEGEQEKLPWADT